MNNPLQTALTKANEILDEPNENNWVHIETIEDCDNKLYKVYLEYGTIHSNGMHERAIAAISYYWFNGRMAVRE